MMFTQSIFEFVPLDAGFLPENIIRNLIDIENGEERERQISFIAADFMDVIYSNNHHVDEVDEDIENLALRVLDVSKYEMELDDGFTTEVARDFVAELKERLFAETF